MPEFRFVVRREDSYRGLGTLSVTSESIVFAMRLAPPLRYKVTYHKSGQFHHKYADVDGPERYAFEPMFGPKLGEFHGSVQFPAVFIPPTSRHLFAAKPPKKGDFVLNLDTLKEERSYQIQPFLAERALEHDIETVLAIQEFTTVVIHEPRVLIIVGFHPPGVLVERVPGGRY